MGFWSKENAGLSGRHRATPANFGDEPSTHVNEIVREKTGRVKVITQGKPKPRPQGCMGRLRQAFRRRFAVA
jgi:hypothetical protein